MVSVVLVQTDENYAILTPFGSLVRVNPAKVSSGNWQAGLRAVLGVKDKSYRPAKLQVGKP